MVYIRKMHKITIRNRKLYWLFIGNEEMREFYLKKLCPSMVHYKLLNEFQVGPERWEITYASNI